MLSVLGFLLLLVAFYGFAFGATHLLIRRSPWEQYSLEAAWLTGPALVVLVMSLLAYRVPEHVFVWQAWLLLATGWGLSASVVVWDRHQLLQLVRAHWLRWLALTASALLASGVMLWFFERNTWDDVWVPYAREYINYAELAATLTGHHQGQPGPAVLPFCAITRPLRFGQDLIVATVAQVAQRHPLQVVVPIAVVLRFQQTIMMGLLLCSLVRLFEKGVGSLCAEHPPGRSGKGSRPFFRSALILFLLIEALVSAELVSFGSSFLSSNITMPLFAIYLVWLACQQEFRARQCVIIVLMNLFFLLTYPEFLVLAKCFELLSLGIALWRGNRRHWLPLAVCNLAVVLMHPLLLVAKFNALRDQFGHVNMEGWNVMEDPVSHPFHFIASWLGFRFGDLGCDPLHALWPLNNAVAILVLALVAVGLVRLARQYRMGLMLLAWAAGLVLVHASGAAHGNCYVGFKVLSHTYFVVLVGAAAAVMGTTSTRWRVVAAAIGVVWLGLCGYSTRAELRFAHKNVGCHVSFGQLRAALARSAKGQEVTALSMCPAPFGLLNIISGETGLPLAVVNPKEHSLLAWWMLGRGRVCAQREADGTLFRGLVLVDAQVRQAGELTVNDQVLKFECSKVLETIGWLTLCQGRISQQKR
jgi:hypothetical protein